MKGGEHAGVTGRNEAFGRVALGLTVASLSGAGLFGPVAIAAEAARLFVTPAQCERVGRLGAEACRTAFANALAEFDSKAPRFPSRRACFRSFGPCMPWPIGTHRFAEFRPQWIGIALTPDGTVRPAVAPGRQTLAFAPQSTATLSAAAVDTVAHRPELESVPDAKIMTPDDETADTGPQGRVGGGFTMIDGVLTYPAPARFQPKALKQP